MAWSKGNLGKFNNIFGAKGRGTVQEKKWEAKATEFRQDGVIRCQSDAFPNRESLNSMSLNLFIFCSAF
jgi:flagellum-specific peptidoglycan hydrolase FlgJ